MKKSKKVDPIIIKFLMTMMTPSIKIYNSDDREKFVYAKFVNPNSNSHPGIALLITFDQLENNGIVNRYSIGFVCVNQISDSLPSKDMTLSGSFKFNKTLFDIWIDNQFLDSVEVNVPTKSDKITLDLSSMSNEVNQNNIDPRYI